MSEATVTSVLAFSPTFVRFVRARDVPAPQSRDPYAGAKLAVGLRPHPRSYFARETSAQEILLSFFDEGDEPRTRVSRPSRPSRPGGSRTGGTGGGGTDDAIRNRRIVAAVIGVLLLLLLVIVVRGCLESAADNALKDYNADVASIVERSDREVGQPFFDLMSQGGQSPVELESQINQLRVVADQQLDEAEGFDTPDELTTAQRNLLLTLDLRRSALSRIASEVQTALADDAGGEAEDATNQIAAQMQAFLSSDVVYDARVRPFIGEVLDEREIGGQEIGDTQFLPNLTWLDPAEVADRLGAAGGGGGSGGAGGEPAPGLHGHGLESVTVGDLTLTPDATNRIPAGADLAFDVTFANQGENEETDVPVTVTIKGSGDEITARKRVDATQAGSNATVSIPLAEAPPMGSAVTIEVTVGKVPGEEKTDNNTEEYPAIFTR